MQLEHLCEAVLDEDLQEMLGRLPLEISELYSQIYEKMLARRSSTSIAIIQNSLKWLLSSRIPLKSSDFREAISMNINISLERLSNDHILDLLNNFLVLDRDLDVFRFAHLSVAEYLAESRPEYNDSLCKALAAEICLVKLIESSRCPDVGKFFHRLGLHVRGTASNAPESYVEGLHRYALKMWAWHSKCAGEEQRTRDGRFKDVFHFFLFDDCGDTSPLSTCVRNEVVWRGSRPIGELIMNHSASLARSYFLACAHGFCDILRISLTGSELTDDMRRTGLRLAVLHKQEGVVKLLVDVDEIEEDLMDAMVRHLSLEALTWLLESCPKTKITKEVLVAANSRDGKIMALLLDHGKDLMITKEIIESASGAAESSTLEVLLGRAGDGEITEIALSRAVIWRDFAVVNLLLESGGHSCITSHVLGQAAYSGKENTLRLLLDQMERIDITEEVIESAAQCSIPSGAGTMRMLLENGGKMTQQAVLEAARAGRQPVLEVLLDLGGKLSEQVLRNAAQNLNHGRAVLEALIERISSKSILVDAFTKMMVMAAENPWSGPDVVECLLGQESCKGIKIVEEVLLKANTISGNKILPLLLEDGRDIEITEKALESILEHLDFDETIQVLLQRGHAIGTTQGMLAAAAKNIRHGDELLRLLLSRPNMPPVTEETIKSVVANEVFGMEMIALLEKHYGKLYITDEVLKECAAHGSLATFEYIVAHSKTTNISQEMFECCTWTGNWKVRQYILRQGKNIRITQDCIDAAGGNAKDGNHMIRVLLQEQIDGRITDETLKQAMQYNTSAERFLLQRGRITCLSADVLMAALHIPSYYDFGIQFLLGSVLKVEISETLLEAAAKDDSENFGLLLSRNTQVPLTERVLKAAAANLWLDESTLNVLLSSKGAVESITEEVQTTAAVCGNLSFFNAMSRVESRVPTEVEWGEIARLRVAVRNGDHETVSRLLQALSIDIDMLDLSGRTILSIAAEKGHYQVVKLLLEAKADPNSKASVGSSQERTPLFWAVCEGHHDVVEILMDAGAEVNV